MLGYQAQAYMVLGLLLNETLPIHFHMFQMSFHTSAAFSVRKAFQVYFDQGG